MRILLIHPGDDFSTADVFDGLAMGLRANGHEVIEARLDEGLVVMAEAVAYLNAYFPGTPPAWAQDAFALCGPRLIAQAAWLQPDLVLAVNGLKLHYSVPLTVRKLGIPTAVLFTETPYSGGERVLAPMYDHILTNERRAVRDRLFGDHPSVHYLPHAYNPNRHYPRPADPSRAADVFFVGTGFEERKALFGGVDWTGIDFRLMGAGWDVRLKDVATAPLTELWADVLPNADAAAWYAGSKVCLNHFRTTAEIAEETTLPANYAESLGPRAYEIPACGGFMVSDPRPELRDVFGDSVPTYRPGDPDDLGRVVRHYLAHPEERERLRAEQHRRVQGHTWVARAKQAIDYLVLADALAKGVLA